VINNSVFRLQVAYCVRVNSKTEIFLQKNHMWMNSESSAELWPPLERGQLSPTFHHLIVVVQMLDEFPEGSRLSGCIPPPIVWHHH